MVAVGGVQAARADTPPAHEAAAQRDHAVELAAGGHGSYQPYNGADDLTVGGWTSALWRLGGGRESLAFGVRGSLGWMNDPLSEQGFRTHLQAGSALARGARCSRWTCVGIGLELGVARISRIDEIGDATTRTRGFLGVPLSLQLGARRPLAFVVEAGPRLRLGTDFGGQEPGDGGYKSAIGVFVGLGLVYAIAL